MNAVLRIYADYVIAHLFKVGIFFVKRKPPAKPRVPKDYNILPFGVGLIQENVDEGAFAVSAQATPPQCCQ